MADPFEAPVLGAAVLAALLLSAAPAQPTETWIVTDLGSAPLVFTPPAGLPSGRLGGGVRGGPDRPQVVALVPREVALTLEAQPTLYWYLSARTTEPLEVTLNDVDGMKTLLRKTLRAPRDPGIQALRLAELGVRLAVGRHYEWLVSFAGRSAEGSGGVVRRDQPGAELRASLDRADAASRVRLLAANGIWYDAFDLLSRSIARRPGDTTLRAARAGLLEQVGLVQPAAWDRAR